MVANGTTTQLEGVVARSNDRGLVLDGHDGWLNISKYADGVLIPDNGSSVRLHLDKSGFIRGIDVLALATRLRAPLEPGVAPDRDHRILRQAVLNTATAILGS